MSVMQKTTEKRDTVRIGADYQAEIPDYDPTKEYGRMEIGSTAIWIPNNNISDEDLDAYIKNAKENYSYSEEQALGMLYCHNYDFTKAEEDLKNFKPVCKNWEDVEKDLFRDALNKFGKDFLKIRTEVLPHRTTKELIEFYYKNKKKDLEFNLKSKQIENPEPISNAETIENVELIVHPKPKRKWQARWGRKTQIKRNVSQKQSNEIKKIGRKSKRLEMINSEEVPSTSLTVFNKNNNEEDEDLEIEIIYERISEPTIRT